MADEFVKGLAIFSGAGLVWLVIAGWFKTPSFYDAQLFGEEPENPEMLVEFALTLGDVMFWFAIIGALTFWLVIPLGRETRAYLDQRNEA